MLQVGRNSRTYLARMAASNKVPQLNRLVCREHGVKNFSVEHMSDGYEAVYQ